MSVWGMWAWVILPRLFRPLGFSFGLALALSLGDLGVIVLLAAPRMRHCPIKSCSYVQDTGLMRRQGHQCYYLSCVCSRLLLSMDWDADMLSIKNLKFGHGSHIVVAENTAFGGGIYGVIGPSGSGKSTFLNTLAGFHELNLDLQCMKIGIC